MNKCNCDTEHGHALSCSDWGVSGSTEKGWEKRFRDLWDKVFPARDGALLKGSSPRFPTKREEIESFIRQNRTSFIQEVIEMVEGMKNELPNDLWNENEQGRWQALTDLLTKLKEKKI